MKYFFLLFIVMNYAFANENCTIGVCVGDRIFVGKYIDTQARVISVNQQNFSVSVMYLDNGQEGNIEHNIGIGHIVRTERDLNGFTANETVLYVDDTESANAELALVKIIGKNPDDSLRIKFLEGELAGQVTLARRPNLKKMQGCEAGHCVNDIVYVRSQGAYQKTRIVALLAHREYYVEILEGRWAGAVVGRANTYYDFAKTKGCIKGGLFQKEICVGATGKLKTQRKEDVRVVGIRDDGGIVVESLGNDFESLMTVRKEELKI